ncbi:MAG: protein kinase [Planctomycetes bacterium]|nr:protein kinase [Planctomycetota bacterium]
MSEQPPKELVATLESLGLATAGQVARMGRRVRRLAGDLPRFESVWVDALAQARLLTPFQAAELNAGRGRRLRVGPYVLCQRLPYPLYAAGYRARHVETREMARLAVIEDGGTRLDEIIQRLEHQVAGEPATPRSSPLSPLPSPLFVAEPWVDGKTAAEWMVQHGRFPPEVVLEIARSMLARLVELEKSGGCHGDVSASGLILTGSGEVVLPWPGLRGILRPEEGYAHIDLPPEAFDNMAPERIASGTPPTVVSDIFACGCLWWHLLCGRPPLAGGDSLAKLRSAERCEIRDVRENAPDAPPTLAAAISACVKIEPKHRPESMARLAATLGPPTRDGREALIGALNRSGRPAVRWTTTARSIRRSSRTPLWLAAAACTLATAVAIAWPGVRGQGSGSRVQEIGKSQIPNPKSPAPHPQSPVVPAAYQQPAQPPMELVLPADRPTEAGALRLRAGQCVRAPSGRRAVVLSPRIGLIVDRENVRFENIDFRRVPLAKPVPPSENGGRGAEAALVRLLAGGAEFHGCRFQAETGLIPVSAIRWIHPAAMEESETSLPSGRIVLTDCLLDGVEAGIDCRTVGALGIQLTNTLHLGPGPLVQLDHCPRPDESVSLALSQVTLRGGGPLLECFIADIADITDAKRQPGEISVLATACVFAPEQGRPLVRVHSVDAPRRFLDCLRWTGQGSLVAPLVPILAWRGPDARQRVVDESALTIAGLVRSEVGFADAATSDPSSSRIIHWQAPLQTADPPGIDPSRLPAGE